MIFAQSKSSRLYCKLGIISYLSSRITRITRMLLGFFLKVSRNNALGKNAPRKTAPRTIDPGKLPYPHQENRPQKIFCEFFLISNFYLYGNFRS